MNRDKFKDKKEWRKFGLSVSLILGSLALLQFLMHKPHYPVLLGIAVLFSVTGMLAPVFLKPVYIVFSFLGLVMGWIMTRVILTLLFFIILTPITLISRLFRKQYLALSVQNKKSSYWLDRERKTFQKIDYERQF